jgi:probable rRNA maturation factor
MSTPERTQLPQGKAAQPTTEKIERSIAIEVEISNTQAFLAVDTDELVQLARRVLQAEGITRASISLALVDNATIHEVNRQHLGHDWPTDVISFPLSEPEDPELGGELVISAEMAVATAHEMNVAPADELALYVVHGLLHLCGYDDHSQQDAHQMRNRENQILRGGGIRGVPAGSLWPCPAQERQEPPSCSG